MKEIITSAGLSITLDEECFNDMELLQKLVTIEKGDLSALPEAVDLILGAEKGRFYESLRNEKGRVPIDAVVSEIRGIVDQLGKRNF